MATHPSREPKERISKSLSRASRFNVKCVLSLCLVLAGVWLLGMSMVMTRNYKLRLLTGFCGLLVFVIVISAVFLAILGLIDCRGKPESFRSSRSMAVTTLWIA